MPNLSQFFIPQQPQGQPAETITIGERVTDNPFVTPPKTDFSGLNASLKSLSALRGRITPQALFNSQAESIAANTRATGRNFSEQAARSGVGLAGRTAFLRQLNRDAGAATAAARRQALVDSTRADQSIIGQALQAQLGAANTQSSERTVDRDFAMNLIQNILNS